MRILFIGDIFASPGRKIVADKLHYIVSTEQIDLVVANAENAAGGFGVTPLITEELLKLGVDVLTTGNHIWDKREIYDYLAGQPRLLRPANYPSELPGTGVAVLKARDGAECAVINLQGRAHMPATDCPFRKADQILAELPPGVRVRLVDFHAELTSEKMAMGWYLNGRVTAVVGTHTHIPTADTRLLPGGTAYQTDVGMTGPYASVIGVDKDVILRRFLTSLPVRMEYAHGGVELHAVIIDADEATGKACGIKRYSATEL
ncbi:MAG: TIGR00282 family metallophosphoesterase [Acidobacteria bacterium]|nr:TIGR00282 family metallophosphoesterase [Acidobacteriota bacterium]MBI3280338.1 TIGR00282 family metallophosphoesterase [Acidobacteriota bacterium]